MLASKVDLPAWPLLIHRYLPILQGQFCFLFVFALSARARKDVPHRAVRWRHGLLCFALGLPRLFKSIHCSIMIACEGEARGQRFHWLLKGGWEWAGRDSWIWLYFNTEKNLHEPSLPPSVPAELFSLSYRGRPLFHKRYRSHICLLFFHTFWIFQMCPGLVVASGGNGEHAHLR